MSFWIHAFCEGPVGVLTPDELKEGITQRFELLTYLFCPEEEEDPDLVLSRLRIEERSAGGTNREFLLHYRPGNTGFISIVRYGRGAALELEEELRVSARPADAKLTPIIQRLSRVTEDFAFCLKTHDVRGMGFPLSIAAAAYLVGRAGGLIQSGTYSWMIPHGNEVKMLLQLNK